MATSEADRNVLRRQADPRAAALAAGAAAPRAAGRTATRVTPPRSGLAPQRRSAPVAAFVLHQWDWSETSLIIDLFTRDAGRLAVVAKGAKRPYSQLRPVLMPFQRLLAGLGRGAGAGEGAPEVMTLRSAEYAGAGAVLPPARLITGFYLNELLLKLLARGDPHALLFDAYADTLLALAQAEDESALRAFELVLLRQTGVLPELDCDTATQAPLQPGRGYRLHPEAGLLATPPMVAESSEAVLQAAHCQLLERALRSAQMPALRAACQLDLSALRQQLRPLLHYHLGSSQLRTRQLMLDVRRLSDGL